MRGLNWFQARVLYYAGKAIRQDSWRKWLTRSLAASHLDRKLDGTASKHIVLNSEFGPSQFMATDWTDEPWDSTPAPPAGPSTTPPGGGAGNYGSAANPPDPSSAYQPGGAGGGGSPSEDSGRHCPSGYTLSSDGRKCIKNDEPETPPTVNVYFPLLDTSGWSGFDSSHTCFLEGTGTQSTSLFVTVNIIGGPSGVGTFMVTLQGQTQNGTAYPGSSQSVEFTGVNFTPGSSITATATYSINGETYTGNATFSFYGFCGSNDDGAGAGLL